MAEHFRERSESGPERSPERGSSSRTGSNYLENVKLFTAAALSGLIARGGPASVIDVCRQAIRIGREMAQEFALDVRNRPR